MSIVSRPQDRQRSAEAVSSKPGFGLFFWSEHSGCWCIQLVSEDRERLEAVRDRFTLFHWMQSLHPVVVQAASASDDDIAAAGEALASPLGVPFFDPAPDGVIIPPSMFDGLCEAASLEAEFCRCWAAASVNLDGGVPDAAHRRLFADLRFAISFRSSVHREPDGGCFSARPLGSH